MNLYTRKQYTKWVLFLLASVIVGISLWYSNDIAKKIRNEERQKVKLWSEAIQKRAKLVAYTQNLFNQLRKEEQKKVNQWFKATSYAVNANENENLNFVSEIIQDNTTIPIILTDKDGKVLIKTNLDPKRENDPAYLKAELSKMKKSYKPLLINYFGNENQYLYYRDSKIFRELQQTMDDLINSFISETVINSASVPVIYTDSTKRKVEAFGNIDSNIVESPEKLALKIKAMSEENEPIVVKLGQGNVNYIFYEDSFILTQLKYYPYFMLAAIGIFLIVSYLLFSTFRNAEQNQVWVGMAKETAHQLGTPLSSLMAWIDLLETQNLEPQLINELKKDVSRLETITERFSKIGSYPELTSSNSLTVVEGIVDYLKPRASRKTSFSISNEAGDKVNNIKLNKPLFEWVIENICKNAIDAMNGEGQINIVLRDKVEHLCIDISDTGKGMPKSKFKTVFQPGYTTKKRGWGLGLSLCKRIIENYHHGKIFVHRSEPNKGTTFRILLQY